MRTGEPLETVFNKRTVKKPAVIIAGSIALEGTALIAASKEEELSEYFYRELVRSAKALKDSVNTENTKALLKGKNVYMKELSQGGVLNALWDLSKETGCGMDIDMRKIPIRQECVEVCEFFSLNPYRLLSGGAVMVITEDEEDTLGLLRKEGIQAETIGYLNRGNDKVLRFGETSGFLNRPEPDELDRILQEKQHAVKYCSS